MNRLSAWLLAHNCAVDRRRHDERPAVFTVSYWRFLAGCAATAFVLVYAALSRGGLR